MPRQLKSRPVPRWDGSPKRRPDTRDRAGHRTGQTGNESREGLAAAIAIDAPAADDRVTGETTTGAKIDARRATRSCGAVRGVCQRTSGEPVSLGIFEFSRRDNQPDCRPIIPMGPPDPPSRCRAGPPDPEGGTPIGQAMVTAKSRLMRPTTPAPAGRPTGRPTASGLRTSRPRSRTPGSREALDSFRRLRHRGAASTRCATRAAGAASGECEGIERDADML